MRPLLGTFVVIRAEAGDEVPIAHVEATVEGAFRAMARVDRLMSFHRTGSDVSRINRCRPGRRLRINRWTFVVLRTAIDLQRASGGAFNCDVGVPLMRTGHLPKAIPRLVARTFRGRRQPAHRFVTCEERTVMVRAAVALDLGGIAKGFAVDKAVDALRARGATAGLVNAGGDMRVFGGNLAPIWIRDPGAPGEARLMGKMADGAIATSAGYFTVGCDAGRSGCSAIVDPATNRRIEMTGSVSVIARTCMLADALTKIAVITGRLPTRLARKAGASILTL